MDSKKDLIIYTGGTFDCFHNGHVNFLRQCSKLGRVIVALNTDSFIQQYKGVAPILTYKERETILNSCKYVDGVVPNIGGADSKITIKKVKPNVIAIGTDWLGKNYYKQMDFTQKWLDDNNIVLMYLPYTVGISTTLIKEKIKNRYAKKK